MRLNRTRFSLIVLLIALVLVQEIKAQFLCGIFKSCTSSSVPEPSASPTPSAPAPSAPSSPTIPSPAPQPSPPASSIVAPKPSSSVAAPSSKPPVPSPTSSVKPTSENDPPSIPSKTADSSSSITSSTATPSTSSDSNEKKGGTNIGVIVGSVCGFVAIIGAGFAYAFFSKTRRNNRNKRLYSENGDMYDHHNNYQSDPFSNNVRPSPALAASAVHAADDIHQHSNNNANQWGMMDHQQPYGNYNNNNSTAMMSPQPPMATVAKQHDPYYTNSPQMAYAVDPNTNYYNNQPYYDPNVGYQHQQQHQHYDSHYDQQHYTTEPQYDPYAMQQQQQTQSTNGTVVGAYNQSKTAAAVVPAVATTNSAVYSAPNSYPEDHPAAPTNNGSYR